MDPSALTPDPLALDDLDDEGDPEDGDPHDDDDNYGDAPQDGAPVLAEPDPIEMAIARGAPPVAVLHLIKVRLARLSAYLGWIRENPGVFSMSRQVDLARAVGRQTRALSLLARQILVEEREGPEPDPPPEIVDRLVGLLHTEVIKVLREVATPQQASAFEAKLAEKMAADNASRLPA